MIYVLTEQTMNETAINSDYPITTLREMYNEACSRNQLLLVYLAEGYHLTVKYIDERELEIPARRAYLFTEDAWM